jgi:predicted enzyme related to lactoylglutathione lyase
MIKKIAVVIVIVSDMKRSVEFYRDKLGVPLEFESPHWTQFRTEGATLGLHPESEHMKAKPGGVQVGFQVEDLDKAYEVLLSRGVEFAMPPRQEDFGGKLAVCLDPDGYSISLSDQGA